MSYKVAEKAVTGTPVLFQKRTVPASEIAQALGQVLPAVWTHAKQAGLEIAGPPFCRYPDMCDGNITFEAGLPLTTAGDSQGEFVAGTLHEGTAAATIHSGPYEGLPEAYQAVEAWLKENDKTPSGPPWEVYLTDPGAEPDASKWQTEVFFPLG